MMSRSETGISIQRSYNALIIDTTYRMQYAISSSSKCLLFLWFELEFGKECISDHRAQLKFLAIDTQNKTEINSTTQKVSTTTKQ